MSLCYLVPVVVDVLKRNLLNNGVLNAKIDCCAIRDVAVPNQQQQQFFYFQQMPGESTFNLQEQQQQVLIDRFD